MKTIKISAIIMSLIMVCCLCLSCLEGSAGGSSTESFRCTDPITSASEREDSGPSESTDPITSASEKEDSDSSGGETEECVHELQRTVVAETCTTVGGTVETCKKNCGYKKIYGKVLPTEHNIVKGVCKACKKAENEIEWYECKFHWAVGDDGKVETFKIDKQTEDIGEVLENKAWEIAWKHREESPSLKWAVIGEPESEGPFLWATADRSIAFNFAYWNESYLDFYKHMGQPGCGDYLDYTWHHFMNETDYPGTPLCSAVGYRYGECEQCDYKAWLNDIPACGHEYAERDGKEICNWCERTREEIEKESV